VAKLIKALRAEMRAAAKGESKQAVAALRAELRAIRKALALLARQVASGRGGAAGARAGRAVSVPASGGPGDGRRARFAPALMRKHRQALGMSRKAYAGLLGVSGLSVYLWEAGRNKPRRDTVLAWQDLRKKGARELRAMAGTPSPRRKRRASKKSAAPKRVVAGRAAGSKRAAATKRARRVARGARRRRAKAA
jgi:DNA-binding XRE family transcriptional regulator